MKRFKKLLSALLACVMILGSVSVCATENISVLKGMGIAPDGFTDVVGGEKITRGEYAYMLANILNKDEMAAMDTRFTDVTKADYMSGQIEFLATRGVAGGYGDGTFGKDDPLTLETAYVFLIRLLGLESFVRAKEGSQSNFTTFAYTIGLKAGKYTDAEGHVTKAGASAILHDALTASLPRTEWSTEGGELILSSEEKSNLLAENLGISSYDAYVTGVDMEKYTVTAEITKNVYKKNPVVIPEGTQKTFIASPGVNIYEYENTPVSIWIDEDEKIIDIQYKKDVEIRYVNIVSVNGDEAEHAYRVGSINRMTFLDDEEEYDVAENATYKLNGKSFTGQTALAGNYAKVVLIKNEVTYVESWDLEEGGIITEITDERITYTNGDKSIYIRDFDKIKTKIFFLDGRCASISEIKPGAVFYYYKNDADNYFTLVASEIVITDVLSGVSTDEITIGNNILRYDEKFYFKTTGTSYKRSDESKDYFDIYNKNVHAYLAHNGNVLYLVPEDASDITGSFYGVVVGVEEDKRNIGEIADVKLYELNGKEITEKVYKYIKKKSKSPDRIGLDELKNVASDMYGKGIYLFRVNDEGVITQIKRPEAFPIFESSQTSYAYLSGAPLTLMQDGKSLYLQLKDDNYENVDGQAVWFLKPPSVIYKIGVVDGKLEVSTLSVSDIKSQEGVKAKMIVYGEKKSLVPTFMALTSAPKITYKKDGQDVSVDAYDINNLGSADGVQYGVITAKTTVNFDGFNKTKLVVEGLSGMKSYYVENSTASNLGIDTLIGYTINPEHYDNQISIINAGTATADISNDNPETWKTELNKVIKNVQELEVYAAVDEGIFYQYQEKEGTPIEIRAITYRPTEVQILLVDLTGEKRVYKKASTLDIEEGDMMFYQTPDGLKELAIVVKR